MRNIKEWIKEYWKSDAVLTIMLLICFIGAVIFGGLLLSAY
jgi:hypothetical protein